MPMMMMMMMVIGNDDADDDDDVMMVWWWYDDDELILIWPGGEYREGWRGEIHLCRCQHWRKCGKNCWRWGIAIVTIAIDNIIITIAIMIMMMIQMCRCFYQLQSWLEKRRSNGSRWERLWGLDVSSRLMRGNFYDDDIVDDDCDDNDHGMIMMRRIIMMMTFWATDLGGISVVTIYTFRWGEKMDNYYHQYHCHHHHHYHHHHHHHHDHHDCANNIFSGGVERWKPAGVKMGRCSIITRLICFYCHSDNDDFDDDYDDEDKD